MTPLVPNPVGSDEQHARFHHDDLAQLDEVDALAELHRLTFALARIGRRPSCDGEWMRRRWTVLRAALRRRAA